MEKVSPEYHLEMAVVLTNFIDYFITRGASKKDIHNMFNDIVEKIYEDKESLK